jgi:hypothetical protein
LNTNIKIIQNQRPPSSYSLKSNSIPQEDYAYITTSKFTNKPSIQRCSSRTPTKMPLSKEKERKETSKKIKNKLNKDYVLSRMFTSRSKLYSRHSKSRTTTAFHPQSANIKIQNNNFSPINIDTIRLNTAKEMERNKSNLMTLDNMSRNKIRSPKFSKAVSISRHDFLFIEKDKYEKKITIADPQVNKLQKEVQLGPYFSHCPTCNNKNLEFYDNLKPDMAMKILNIMRDEKFKTKGYI